MNLEVSPSQSVRVCLERVPNWIVWANLSATDSWSLGPEALFRTELGIRWGYALVWIRVTTIDMNTTTLFHVATLITHLTILFFFLSKNHQPLCVKILEDRHGQRIERQRERNDSGLNPEPCLCLVLGQCGRDKKILGSRIEGWKTGSSFSSLPGCALPMSRMKRRRTRGSNK